MHDSTLEELCRRRPSNFAELKQVPGIGEKKADVYGAEILQALRNFGEGARAAPTVAKEPAPAEQTLRLLNEGRSFEEIARIRARQVSTIVCTVANLIETGQVKLDPKWISPDAQPLIEAACLKQGVERLKDIKDAVPPYISFDDIRLVVAHLRAENRLRGENSVTVLSVWWRGSAPLRGKAPSPHNQPTSIRPSPPDPKSTCESAG